MPLLRASDHGLPDDATIAVPVPPEGLTLYRLVDGETATVRDFEERRTRPQAERDGIPELPAQRQPLASIRAGCGAQHSSPLLCR